MIINVIENDINTRLSNYLGILEILRQLIESYYNYEIKYYEFIIISQVVCNNVNLNLLLDDIIDILQQFVNMRIIYSSNKYHYIVTNYRFIIRKYKSRKFQLNNVIVKILYKKNIHVSYISNLITDYYL